MRRLLLLSLVVMLAAVFTSAAGAADWNGVVVAKNVKRDTVTTVSKNKMARTVHARHRMRSLHVGQRVHVKARRLADGTFAARSIKTLGSDQSQAAIDDEIEVKGTVSALGTDSITIGSGTAQVTCFTGTEGVGTVAVGDLIEMTCDLVGGQWVVRAAKAEDDFGAEDDFEAEDEFDDDQDQHHGPGNADDDDDDSCPEDAEKDGEEDHSGTGDWDDDEHDGDGHHSGHGDGEVDDE